MNLFKLLNIVAIFILICLGFAISTRVEELDTPFLSIPRVAFETSVPTLDPNRQDRIYNPNSFPISVIDGTKTGILTTKLIDLIIPNISTEFNNIVLFLTDSFKHPVAKIVFTIDRSNSHISINIENSSKKGNNPVAAYDTHPSPDNKLSDQVVRVLQVTPDPVIQQNNSDPGQPVDIPVDPSVINENESNILLQSEIILESPSPVQDEVAIADTQNDSINAQPETDGPQQDAANTELENSHPITSLPAYGYGSWSLGNNPLTGLMPIEEGKLDRRPMMVKISNFPRNGRPHAGLSFADIVFEYYIGEEMNRFLALYYGNDSPQVGPIRSGSPVDAQLTSLYQGIVNYGNEDPQVDGMLIKALEGRALPVWKCPSPPISGADSDSVVGVFGNTEELSSFADKLNVNNTRPSLAGMVFDGNAPISSRQVNKLGIEYSERNRGEWYYDPQTGLYNRWIENFKDGDYFMEPLVDRVNNQQLKFANVIIIFSKYTETNPTRYKIDLWNNRDGQRAIIFRDGLVNEGIWKVESPDQPIQFQDENGTPIPLKPGNSWIVIANEDSSFEEVAPGKWDMLFSLP